MTKRILVVDDEDTILELVERALKRDYEVDLAKSGEEALKKLQETKYNILLTDIVMPNMDGLTLLKKAKEIEPFLQVIVMTGYSTADSMLDCLDSGATEYVLKPFSIHYLKQIIDISSERFDRWIEAMKKTTEK